MDDKNEKQRRIPKLRLPGFTDEWERRKLEEYLDVSYEKNTKNVYDKSDVLSVSGDYGIVNQIEFQGRSFAGASVSNYGVVHKGDVVYTKSPLKSNPYGIIKTNRRKTGIVSTLYAVYRAKENVCADFVQTYFEHHVRMNNYMQPLVNKGAKNDMKVSAGNALKGFVIFPKIEEQEAIFDFFASIDRLITFHQRKIKDLESWKAGMLQKMFPRDGKKVPEIRYSGYINEWKQCKLREIAIFNPKENLPDTFEYVNLESVVGTEMLAHRTESKHTAPSRAQRVAHMGDLFYQTVRPYQKNNYLFEKSDNNYVFSTGYAQLRPLVDGYFLLSLVQCEHFVKAVLDNCIGTGYPAINANDLADIEVYSTTESEEYRRIGAFFRNLDRLITLHNHKLNHIKELKRGLLQQMFV